MRQEDYILREIHRIGEFLLALMGKQKIKKDIHELKNELRENLSFTLDELLLKTGDDLSDLLLNENGFNTVNMEYLADLLAEQPDIKYWKKAIELYQLCEMRDRTFSIERDYKLHALIKKLK